VRRALFGLHHESVRLPRVGRVAAALADLAGPAESILDVGAGDGLVGRALAERLGARVLGVDVHVQPRSAIPVEPYDGRRLPFEDGAFDVVTLADVLHHADAPERLLAETLRVARRAVVVKDHYRESAAAGAMLWALDVAGNASQGILVRGHYFSRASWRACVGDAGGRVEAEIWPLHVHTFPLRLVTRSELQFACRVVRRGQEDRS
jgi:SAM-dependent methyltransferase